MRATLLLRTAGLLVLNGPKVSTVETSPLSGACSEAYGEMGDLGQ